MDIMDEGLLDFWRVLNKHEIAYIMTGGFAMQLYGLAYAAADHADFWLKDTLPNRVNFRKACVELGYGDIVSLETMDFTLSYTQLSIDNGIDLTILTSLKGLEHKSFDECFQAARVADLDGVLVPFLHINDLLINKKAVARPKDQLDVIELEKIKKYLEEKDGRMTR